MTAFIVAAIAILLAAVAIGLWLLPAAINRRRYRALLDEVAGWPEAAQRNAREGLVLIPTFGRPEYLRQVLEALPGITDFERHHVMFSQDGNNPAVTALIADWRRRHPLSLHMRHARPWFALPTLLLGWTGLRREYLISANIHSLTQFAFDWLKARWVIVVEDDLVPGHDFLPFFRAAHDQLLAAPEHADGLLAVCGWSNWNFSRPVADAEADPALLYEVKLTRFNSWGWSFDASRWPLVRSIWDRGYFVSWDYAMQRLREATGRTCANPVVSRVLNVGMRGVNFREDPANPGLRWQTQSVLSATSAVRFDPDLPLRTTPFEPSQVTFSDGAWSGDVFE